ncbi:MAG: hypothetical protein EOP84_17910 [Verrucomicrobiaceae bacterium]|nr:MAG: hypothetical protein EOP84_17910 [Verrucomicrobiaceae bacterium]
MSFAFQIRPLSLMRGFQLTCDGILPDAQNYPRLFEAIVQAAQLGRDLDGEIQIFDTTGHLIEALPLHINNPHPVHG